MMNDVTKNLVEMSDDALLIKLCDRLDKLSEIIYIDDDFKENYINETIEILDYLTENRKLNDNHIDVIRDIFNKIYELNNKKNSIKK